MIRLTPSVNIRSASGFIANGCSCQRDDSGSPVKLSAATIGCPFTCAIDAASLGVRRIVQLFWKIVERPNQNSHRLMSAFAPICSSSIGPRS